MAIGKLVDDRGICCGYCADGLMFINGAATNPISISKKAKNEDIQHKPEACHTTARKFPTYDELPIAADRDGECCVCYKFPNEKDFVETDQGCKLLIVCSHCGELMRPFEFNW